MMYHIRRPRKYSNVVPENDQKSLRRDVHQWQGAVQYPEPQGAGDAGRAAARGGEQVTKSVEKETSARSAEVYVPQRGDRVRYKFDDTDYWGEGVIVAEGLLQSTWRADSDRQERVRINADFQLVERPTGARVTTAPRAATRAALEASEFQPGARMSRARDGNPKREGSSAHARWALALAHCDSRSTVGEFLAVGGNPATLANAVAAGYARVNDGEKK